ncbi:MAG: four helix bundle protein [Flavobacteriales bacterium]|nr:four helix bundle protein [Flavobacteriales bacterium]MCB9449251.1 four helix bundle protein [Flavobacteriales bacterium]
MFDFEKLDVYHKSKQHYKEVVSFLSRTRTDRFLADQLRRASLSIMLNIAEGTGRLTKRDKNRFFIIARGSVFECAAIFDHLTDLHPSLENNCKLFRLKLEELSKMLFSMMKVNSE